MSFDARKKPLPAIFKGLPDSATLGTPELMRLFDCHETTILNWVKNGHLPKPCLLGGARIYKNAYVPSGPRKDHLVVKANRFDVGSLRQLLGQDA